MDFYISQVINLLILFVAIIGWIRFKKISPAYYPFLILIWIATANEIYSAIVIKYLDGHTIVNSNLYWLIEAFLMLWQFKLWGLFWKKKGLHNFLFFSFIFIWLAESLLLSKVHLEYNSYFRIFYSFVLVLASVSMINQIMMKERGKLAKNSTFIICIAFIFGLTYSLLIELFYIYHLQLSIAFSSNLHHIFIIINLLCNILNILATLWMPKKQAFTLQY